MWAGWAHLTNGDESTKWHAQWMSVKLDLDLKHGAAAPPCRTEEGSIAGFWAVRR